MSFYSWLFFKPLREIFAVTCKVFIRKPISHFIVENIECVAWRSQFPRECTFYTASLDVFHADKKFGLRRAIIPNQIGFIVSHHAFVEIMITVFNAIA